MNFIFFPPSKILTFFPEFSIFFLAQLIQFSESKSTKPDPVPDLNQPSSTKTHEEYTNPVYTELEKSELNIFETETTTDNTPNEDRNEDELNIFSEVQM